jgi:tRNA modification GTPase
VILACASGDSPSIDLPDDDRTIRVWTKADIAPPPADDARWIATSAATGAGLDELKRAVAAAIRRRESEPASPTSARCRDSLLRASGSLRAGSAAMAAGAGDELIAFDLRATLDDLAEVTGAVVADDVLDRVFARFCIGK